MALRHCIAHARASDAMIPLHASTDNKKLCICAAVLVHLFWRYHFCTLVLTCSKGCSSRDTEDASH